MPSLGCLQLCLDIEGHHKQYFRTASISPLVNRWHGSQWVFSAGTSVFQVTATDADDPTYGNSARVVYSILHGQPYFSVDPQTGKGTDHFIISLLIPFYVSTVFWEIFVLVKSCDQRLHMSAEQSLVHTLHQNLENLDPSRKEDFLVCSLCAPLHFQTQWIFLFHNLHT